MFALSSDRFHLFVLVDQDHNHTIGKSKVNLKIMTSSKSLVTWYYKASVSYDQDQQKFYEKIFDKLHRLILKKDCADNHIEKSDKRIKNNLNIIILFRR